MQRIDAYVDGELVYTGNRSQCIIDLGALKKGTQVRVIISLKNPENPSATMYAAAIDNKVLQDTYDMLSIYQFQVREYWDDYLKGTISLDDTSNVLLTIPYAEGWTLKVDGKETEPDKWCGLFMMLELSEGTHTIEMSYVTPGFRLGLYITLASAALFLTALTVTLAVAGHRRKKSASAVTVNNAAADNIPEPVPVLYEEAEPEFHMSEEERVISDDDRSVSMYGEEEKSEAVVELRKIEEPVPPVPEKKPEASPDSHKDNKTKKKKKSHKPVATFIIGNGKK